MKILKINITCIVLTFLIILTSNISVFAQNYQWARNATGNLDEQSFSVTKDPFGNILITGFFEGDSISFGNTTLYNPYYGWYEYFLAKYDSIGNLIWAKSATGLYHDYGFGVATDALGNIIVTGYFDSPTITFDNITLTNDNIFGTADMFIVKYNSNGNVIWAKRAGGNLDDYAYGISTDPVGNVFVTGFFASDTIRFGNTTLINSGIYDIFVVKYSSSGNVVWAKGIGGVGQEEGKSVTTDVNGNVLVTGYFSSPSISFGSTTLTNSGSYDIFTVKYNSSGTVLWANGHGGVSTDVGQNITTDPTGNVIVTGVFYQSILFGSTVCISNGLLDAFILKYDASGNVLWAKSAGGSGNDRGYGVTTDHLGNIIAVGFFKSQVISLGLNTMTNSSPGSSDLFIYKLDSYGNLLVSVSAGNSTFAGSSNDDQCYSVTTDVSGEIIITGIFSDSIDFGSTNLTDEMGSFFLAKLNPSYSTNILNYLNDKKDNIYPNPTSGILNIESNELIKRIELFDMLGKLVMTYGNERQIDISNLQSGLYLLRFTSDNGVEQRRVEVVR